MGGDDQDDMDLEAIIRELEAQLEGSEEEEEGIYEEAEEEEESKNESYSDGSDAGTDKSEDPKVVMNNEGEDVTNATVKGKVGSFDNVSEDVIDLEEILREMEKDMKDGEEEKKNDAKDAELNEAYATIKSLQKTINEVNLLNAKLLFANKLFRAHNMTNEQKVKVIETLDRTNSVREVKLVYATLAENFRYSTPTQKSVKKSITEGIASKVVKSTAPKSEAKQVIAENTQFADRFKKLAGIIK
jgi:methanogenic corrinoid protein MtbC1